MTMPASDPPPAPAARTGARRAPWAQRAARMLVGIMAGLDRVLDAAFPLTRAWRDGAAAPPRASSDAPAAPPHAPPAHAPGTGGGLHAGSMAWAAILALSALALGWRGATMPPPPADPAAALATVRAYLAAEQAAAARLDAAPLEAVTTANGPLQAQRRAALAARRAAGRRYTAQALAWQGRVVQQGGRAWVTTDETWIIQEFDRDAQRIRSQVRYELHWDADASMWRIASAHVLAVSPAAP